MADIHSSLAKLEKRSKSLRTALLKNHPKAKKFYKKSYLIADFLRDRSRTLLAGIGLIGTVITTPVMDLPPQQKSEVPHPVNKPHDLANKLQDYLPHSPSKLTEEGSTIIESLITEYTNIPVKAYYEGQSLNHHVGYIGFEQHLYRYPGDTLADHDDVLEAGIAPGLGAYGHFARSKSEFTTKHYLQEKYYCVVQTLYLPNWETDYRKLYAWYRHRKMLVLNPINGKAVVCDISDAGPAEWTGKQFGGSPETMDYLGLNHGKRKGLIVMMFVDDPQDKITLGPINY
jgi:hypothetical protein